MCGIVGLYLKNPALEHQLGALFEPMLLAMTDRGPDSAGFAIYGDEVKDGWIKLTLQSTTAGYDAGGILGNDSTNLVIEDCYALGGVYSGVRHAAGISGDFNGDSTANTIRRCYAIPAKLSGAQGNGMIAGLWGKAKMENCYFPNDTACGSTTATASGNVAGASGLPLASFTNAASFSGWDIGGSGSAWVMGENGPELKVFAQRRAGG